MAVTTVTATAVARPATLVHAGINALQAKYVHSGTLGDIILMAKIPTGVDIVGVYGRITTAETAANATVGIQGSAAVFGSLASGASPVFTVQGADPYRVSLTDGAQPRYTHIVVSPTSGTWTISATVDLTVLYAAKGQVSTSQTE